MNIIFRNRTGHFFAIVGIAFFLILLLTGIGVSAEATWKIYGMIIAALFFLDCLVFFRALKIAWYYSNKLGRTWAEVVEDVLVIGIYRIKKMEKRDFIRLKDKVKREIKAKGRPSTKRSWG